MDWIGTLQAISKALPYLLSLAVLFAGILLITYKDYEKIEEKLGKEKGMRKVAHPFLETNIYVFDEWLLKKKMAVGIICILTAVAGIYQIAISIH